LIIRHPLLACYHAASPANDLLQMMLSISHNMISHFDDGSVSDAKRWLPDLTRLTLTVLVAGYRRAGAFCQSFDDDGEVRFRRQTLAT